LALPPSDSSSTALVPYEPTLNAIKSHKLHSNMSSPALDPILEVDLETIPKPIKDRTLVTIPGERPLLTPLPMDIVNNSLPKRVTMSQDALHRAIGFQSPSVLLKNIHKLGTKSVQIQNLQRSDNIDIGETASMNSARRNTTPLPSPKNYSDIWHMDIRYGPGAAFGGVKYTLLLINKYSRYKFLYRLKNLTTSVQQAIEQFLRDCGTSQKLIRTDFDHKLMGGGRNS
jgi:hypothetical protein